MSKRTIVMTGAIGEPDEKIFTNDVGTWNVTKIQRDADAGKFGHPWFMDVVEAIKANAAVEVDEAKIDAFMVEMDVLAKPLLAVIEDGRAWLVDGHHRLRALHRLGMPEFPAYVVEEPHGKDYHVLYDGKRKLPPDASERLRDAGYTGGPPQTKEQETLLRKAISDRLRDD